MGTSLEPALHNQPGVMPISHTASAQSTEDATKSKPGPSTSVNVAIAPKVAFKLSKMSINQSQINQPQIITHAVNQLWTAYNPNAEPISGPMHGRRCDVCKEAGREGFDCPGKSNCTKCKYNCKCYT